MDSMINAAARALAAGDPLGALNRVALRDDPPALALRGVAMAQVGDLEAARSLLRSAQRAFGAKAPVARARCVVAEAEVALASRDLAFPARALDAARATLEAHGDRMNAVHAQLLEARRLLLIGRIGAAARVLDAVSARELTPVLAGVHAMARAGVAMRRLRASDARAALALAHEAARRSRVPALAGEVDQAARALDAPAARFLAQGTVRSLPLADVEALLASDALVVDACRYAVRERGRTVALATRPVLLEIARTLAEAWPGDATREALVARAFRGKVADESYRVRLRVEIGRLRALLRPIAGIVASRDGFMLAPQRAREVVVLAPFVDDRHAALLALMADGESWSTSGLALATGESQRNVQRALEALSARGRVQGVGRGRARRWMTPQAPAFATTLLLPPPLPDG